MLKKRKRRESAAEWLKAVYTRGRIPYTFLEFLEGKVELTYWDRSDRLVAFMYPPVSVCRAEMIPLLFLPLPPLFTHHH